MRTSLLSPCRTLLQNGSCLPTSGINRGSQAEKHLKYTVLTAAEASAVPGPVLRAEDPQNYQHPTAALWGLLISAGSKAHTGHCNTCWQGPRGTQVLLSTPAFQESLLGDVTLSKNVSEARQPRCYVGIMRYGAQPSSKNQRIRISGDVSWTCALFKKSRRWTLIDTESELKKNESASGRRVGAMF